MDPQVPTSFIPKKPLVGEAHGSGAAGGLLTLLAILIFIASVAAAGGAFAYGRYLQGAIQSKSDSLTKDEGAFDTQSIETLERLDSRLTQAGTLLQGHVALSGVFTFLAATTLQQVQFTSLTLDMQGDGSAKLTMSGTADSFSTLALQSDEFGAAKALKDVIFSGITTDASGRVVFTVDATVDPSLVSYAKNGGASVQANPAPPAGSGQAATTTQN